MDVAVALSLLISEVTQDPWSRMPTWRGLHADMATTSSGVVVWSSWSCW